MPEDQVLVNLKEAVKEMDQDAAEKAAQKVVDEDRDILEAIEAATEAIREVGDRFQEGEIYLPELTWGAEAMQGAMDILKPHLEEKDASETSKVLIAAVKGDIHDVGKNLVDIMLDISGFEVENIGTDIPSMDIIDKAEEMGADIIGLSALMTTSIPYQKEVINLLEDMDKREEFYIAVGGGPVSKEMAQDMGADIWAKNAAGAVKACEQALELPSKPSEDFVSEED